MKYIIILGLLCLIYIAGAAIAIYEAGRNMEE